MTIYSTNIRTTFAVIALLSSRDKTPRDLKARKCTWDAVIGVAEKGNYMLAWHENHFGLPRLDQPIPVPMPLFPCSLGPRRNHSWAFHGSMLGFELLLLLDFRSCYFPMRTIRTRRSCATVRHGSIRVRTFRPVTRSTSPPRREDLEHESINCSYKKVILRIAHVEEEWLRAALLSSLSCWSDHVCCMTSWKLESIQKY